MSCGCGGSAYPPEWGLGYLGESTPPSPSAPPPSSGEGAAAWVASAWGWFEQLGPRILDLQHRAAVATAEARQAGDVVRADRGRTITVAVGELYRLHGQVTNKVEEYRGYLGLGRLGAIPIALIPVFVALAALMWWIGARYAYLGNLVDGLRDGSLTPSDLAAIGEAAPGVNVLGIGGNVAGLLALAFGGWLLYQWAKREGYAGFGRNPDLFFIGNPDDELIGERVYALAYRHANNSQPYFHDFRDGVRMSGDPDGSVRLWHPSRRLWRDF